MSSLFFSYLKNNQIITRGECVPHLQHLIDFEICAVSCRFGQLVTEMNNSFWEDVAHVRGEFWGARGVTEAAVFG